MLKTQHIIPSLAYLRTQREAIFAILERYGASEVRVFGRVARGTANTDSDVDLLVCLGQHSLLQRIALMRELSELLDVRVDVVQEKMLKPHVKAQALKEAVWL
jgi:predicted nucleotidyltransferase